MLCFAHHRLRWDDIDRLSRSRKGMFRSSKMSPTGGLIAVRERRNYTLVDRMEGHVEYLEAAGVAWRGGGAARHRPHCPTAAGPDADLAASPCQVGADIDGRPVGLSTVRDVMLYITLVINVVAMGALIAGILMHSGRGGGLSDMFGGGGGAALGSSAAERNLNRITFVFALVWIFTVLALPFLFD